MPFITFVGVAIDDDVVDDGRLEEDDVEELDDKLGATCTQYASLRARFVQLLRISGFKAWNCAAVMLN